MGNAFFRKTAMNIIKRDGTIADFDESRIKNAIAKAVMATHTTLSSDAIDQITHDVFLEIEERFTDLYPNVENVQDVVEKNLVKNGFYEVAKAYILYRAERQKEREVEKEKNIERSFHGQIRVKKENGKFVIFDPYKLKKSIHLAARGYEDSIDEELIFKESLKNVFDTITSKDLTKVAVISAATFIERDPAYSIVASRLFRQRLYKEVIGESLTDKSLETAYKNAFVRSIQNGLAYELLDERMSEFDLKELADYLNIERDEHIEYMGIHTLYDRYYLRKDGHRLELPQGFWMRIAMGLALNEKDKTARAKEFYDVISTMHFMPSTPTLFHAGTKHPQLSSCYLTTVMDDLDHIFKSLHDNARLSKWSGGLGNDWTNLRGTGAWIKSTNIESQGVIPFLKIANDVTAAINRSGKRRGATCAYLETWHYDFEDFIDLRRNTGDERRRTHDMNTAAWVPDLFMKRVLEDEKWTLFSSDEVPDLHHTYGADFEKRYVAYEKKAREGGIRKFKTLQAKDLWRKMLTRLFETGHPWITFKDPCNIRSPQDHAGVIHGSNLCTEITLNTSEDEIAVCNLGSINLYKHVTKQGGLDKEKIAQTVQSAIRMLDNVIDLNYYPTIEAKNSNMRHRPIGMGIMGFQDALFTMGVSFADTQARELADEWMEVISYSAILSSSKLAKERGAYKSYNGSKWDKNLFPLDTIELLEKERGMPINVSRTSKLDWTPVRKHVKDYGMRNSNTMAIAPTSNVANITSVYPSLEPIYKNIYVKSNISGEFTIVNKHLVRDLKAQGLWNKEMLEKLKYADGRLSRIAGIPEKIKQKYLESFEIDPSWQVELTAARAKWIDQSQSHNIFMEGTSGKKLEEIYFQAWHTGLKTTYYLRTLGATQIEKSTLDTKYGFTQKREYKEIAQEPLAAAVGGEQKLCKIEDPDCEACQ